MVSFTTGEKHNFSFRKCEFLPLSI